MVVNHVGNGAQAIEIEELSARGLACGAAFRATPAAESDTDEAVRVEPKLMDLLLYLEERGGQVATRDEILDAVWPETEVAEVALSRSISELRRLLGDDAKQHSSRHTARPIPRISGCSFL